jgi:hypothetical protein
MESDFARAMHGISERAVLKRMRAVNALKDRLERGCWLSRLALEYVFEHDPNTAVKNRALLALKRSSLLPREGHWERHIAF